MKAKERDGDQENENKSQTLIVYFLNGDIGMDGWMERSMDGCKMVGMINKGMDDWLDGWLDGRWMDGWRVGWLDGWSVKKH